MDSDSITIAFGAVHEAENPISKQLQGMLSADVLHVYDLDAAAVTRLYVRGMLTEREAKCARKRLISRIAREIKRAL